MHQRTDLQKNLARAIAEGVNEPVYFGRLNHCKLKKINCLRTQQKLFSLKNAHIFIYPSVLAKLQEKRMGLDKLAPMKIADIAYSLLHGKRTRIFISKYSHIQVLVKVGKRVSRVAYVSEYFSSTVLKSVYYVPNFRLARQMHTKKNTLDGRTFPSSNSS